MSRFPRLLVALLLAGSAPPPPASGQTHPADPPPTVALAADTVVVPLRSVEGRPIVDVLVNGKGPFAFYFDTGAQGSVIDTALAREAGIPLGPAMQASSPGGKGIPARAVYIDRLALGGASLHALPAFAIDRLPAPPGERLRGVLSPYVFVDALVVIDFPGNRLLLYRGALPEPDGKEILGWDPDGNLPEIPIRVGDKEIRVHLDTGAADALTLPSSMAADLPLASVPVEVGRARTVDQEFVVLGAPLKGSVRLGRYRFDDPELRFSDTFESFGNMGSAVLRQFTIILDARNARLRLIHPEGDLVQVPKPPRRYGLRFTDPEATPLVLAGVTPGSPAERAGLRPGDELLTLDGRPVAEINIQARMEAFRQSPLHVTARRGEENLDVTMSLDP